MIMQVFCGLYCSVKNNNGLSMVSQQYEIMNKKPETFSHGLFLTEKHENFLIAF